MNRYLFAAIIPVILSTNCFSQGKGAQIGIFPPQMHQQICQESTFTRFLEIFNTGDSTLDFNAGISPDTTWLSVSPLAGKILPGDTATVEFDFNSSGLPLNNYYANFTINSNDRNHPDTIVLTMLHVQDLTILIQPDSDSICSGCTIKLQTAVFGCSEAYSFSWSSDPPGFSSTDKSPDVSPHVNTTYMVTVTDGNYSSQKSILIKVYGSSGISENQNYTGISVYPNPVKYLLFVRLNSDHAGQGSIRISDLSGRPVQSEEVEVNKGLNEFSLKIGRIDPGVYLLSWQSAIKAFQAIRFCEKIMVY